jgi:hypothetical protein
MWMNEPTEDAAMSVQTTASGWRYWIDPPIGTRGEEDVAEQDPTIGTLVLRPADGDDVAIDLDPKHVAGLAPQELQREIGDVVPDTDDAHEIFDCATFVLPDLIEEAACRSRRAPATSDEPNVFGTTATG